MMFLRYFTSGWFFLRFWRKLFVISMLLLLCSGYGAVAQRAAKKHVSAKHHVRHSARHHRRRSRRGAWKRRGQQAILPDRAREIQEALIRENYLTGEPSGKWDARTRDAMTRYQADNGWQSKVTPDSRALIKLGLGPDYSRQQILNPQAVLDAVASNASSSRGSTGGQDK
jgi:hypothetical protein